MLIHLLSDVYRDSSLRDQIAADPDALVAKYQLTPDDVTVLNTHDLTIIAARAADEARQIVLSLAQPTFGVLFWNPPGPKVKKVTPKKVHPLVEETITVKGSGFEPNAMLTFLRDETLLSATQVEVSPEGTSLTGKITFGADQTGKYIVRVINPSTQKFADWDDYLAVD